MFPVLICGVSRLVSIVDDHSRVVLNDYGPEFDYINASYISVVFCSLILHYFHVFYIYEITFIF